jgi:N-terminal acetyltransferase B complex catalytic subunit
MECLSDTVCGTQCLDGLLKRLVFGKAEGKNTDWHGHVSAVSVSPLYRRLGIAGRLMSHFEQISEDGKGYFVDLFVRVGNKNAIEMYERMGYTVYRRVVGYYSEPDEDAFGKMPSRNEGLTAIL